MPIFLYYICRKISSSNPLPAFTLLYSCPKSGIILPQCFLWPVIFLAGVFAQRLPGASGRGFAILEC
jgi:hypothetical protein